MQDVRTQNRKTEGKTLRLGMLLAVCVLAAALCLLGGCQNTEPKEQEVSQQRSDKLQIGMSFDSFVIERWLRDRDQFSLTAKNLGADVNVQVANGEVEEQISQIRYFIKKKMDVIVVIAVDGAALQEVVAEAKKEGIRVISYDRLLANAGTDLYISFDNAMVGKLMAEALMAELPDGGNIFTIYGSPVDANVAQVRRGFLETLHNSNLNVVYTAYCENWLAELAFDAVEEGLDTTPRNLAGVMCGNDDLASQAFRALAENRLAGKVALVGQDADLAACQRIVEGTQTMTVYKPMEELARTAAEFAAALGYEKMLEEGRIEKQDIPKKALQRLEELPKLPTVQDGIVEAQEGYVTGYASEGEDWEKIENWAETDPRKAQARYFTVDGAALDRERWLKAHPQEAQQGYEVPYYGIEPVAVTAENMDSVIIDSDFHTEEDVYLNTEKKAKSQ